MSQKGEALSVYEELNAQLSALVQADTDMMDFYASNISKLSIEVLNRKRDSVFQANGEQAKAIFDSHGFLGMDRLGAAGAKNFWLIVQHSDYDLDFQEKVLAAMKLEVDRDNASAQDYAYLVDRVRKNKGKKQLYGTQITHDANMWAIPEPLEDSLKVNERRIAIGLVPIETYLNEYMEIHFEMNQAYYEKQGIEKPFAYSLK